MTTSSQRNMNRKRVYCPSCGKRVQGIFIGHPKDTVVVEFHDGSGKGTARVCHGSQARIRYRIALGRLPTGLEK